MKQTVWVYICVERNADDEFIMTSALDRLEHFWDIEYSYFITPDDDETIAHSIWGNGLMTRPMRPAHEMAQAVLNGLVDTPDALVSGRWHEDKYDDYPDPGAVKHWDDRVFEHLTNWANDWDNDEFVGMIVPFLCHL